MWAILSQFVGTDTYFAVSRLTHPWRSEVNQYLYGPMDHIKIIESCRKALKVRILEYWSIEKNDIKPLAITPTFQYSNTPNLIEIQIFQQRLPCFGL